MKKKSIILSLLFLLFISTTVSAQGLYSEGENTVLSSENQVYTGGASLRGITKPTGDVNPEPDAPIGEGILILSVLGSGYALFKKGKSKKA